MEIFTSFWDNTNITNQDVCPVGISRGVPRGGKARELPYRYGRLVALAPTKELFTLWKAGKVTNEEYERRYRSRLEALGVEAVTDLLSKKSSDNEGKPLVLLCWCPGRSFCHRRVFADWYLEKSGQEVPELV